MTHTERAVCSWMGLGPDGEHEEPCGKPASYYVLSPSGHRVYTCVEHLAHAKAQAESGALVHRVADHAPEGDHFGYPSIV